MRTNLGTGTATDTQLVEWSLTGDREAFGRIVERYQSLVCSITYGATGSLTLSEDIAQETFLTAWRQLTALNDATKLRAWLCGIARNLVNNFLRRGQREPVRAAEPLEAIHELPAPGPSPSAQAVSHEEEAILWRALEQMPTAYREPLILFYREQQSVARVAEELELSEDAVKQRLSRGRAMLTEQVAAFVEGALRQTTPGKAFTIGVLAALPVLTTSAKAAAIGATAAKGSAVAKAAAATGLFGAILGPLLIIFGNYAGYRINLDQARSESEREYFKAFYRRLVACIVGFGVVMIPLILWAVINRGKNTLLIAGLIGLAGLSYMAAIVWFSIWSFRRRRVLVAELAAQGITSNTTPAWEYRSRWTLLGLPVVHIRLGGGVPCQRTPVKAWIAAGDLAIGVVLAFGGVAIAPVSIGGLAIGLLPFGGCAVGLFALGGFSLGVWAWGGLALGWQAFGGSAVGWNAAFGGVALARDFALGGFAHAAQANNAVARHFMDSSWFFHFSQVSAGYSWWANLIWVVPMVLCWRTVTRARRQEQA